MNSTYNTDYYIDKFNSSSLSKKELIKHAIDLAIQNIKDQSGGPFGAIIYDPNTSKIVGVGANHVFPDNDPTAHAEITAARDAIKRLGITNFTGLECYTSCECCPMCLSYLLDLGISKIYYSASRKDAANAHFSDEQQYILMTEGYDHCCTKVDSIPVERKEVNETPTSDKLRELCKTNKSCHLPEEFIFTTEFKPHPYSLIALDWARIGRVRDLINPEDPNLDSIKKDKSKILYMNDVYEKLYGNRDIETIINIINNGDNEIIKQIDHQSKLIPFELWISEIQNNNANKY